MLELTANMAPIKDPENHDIIYREIVSQRDIDEKVVRDRGMKVEDNHVVNFDHD